LLNTLQLVEDAVQAGRPFGKGDEETDHGTI
jgi:hypothetical protein